MMRPMEATRGAIAGMRVLQVTAAYPPYFSGTGSVVEQWARELTLSGHHVDVATMIRHEGTRTRAGDAVHWLNPAVRVGNAGLLRGMRALPEFDLLHLHLPFLGGGEQAVRLARARRRPLVVTYHQDLRSTGLRGAAFRAYTRYALPKMLRAAVAVTVPTLDYARESDVWHVLSKARLFELPNPVDTTQFTPSAQTRMLKLPWGPEELSSCFLFVGGLDRAHDFKGVPILLGALAKLPNSCRLIIVGEGEMREHYERIAREFGVRERVHFAGRVAQQDLPGLYASTIATVLPSTTRGEIFGVVLTEAMSCGKPVIASNLPGVRTVIQDGVTGLLARPGDVNDLATRMRTLWQNAALRQTMGQAARKRVQTQYDSRTIASNLANIYRDIIEEWA